MTFRILVSHRLTALALLGLLIAGPGLAGTQRGAAREQGAQHHVVDPDMNLRLRNPRAAIVDPDMNLHRLRKIRRAARRPAVSQRRIERPRR